MAVFLPRSPDRRVSRSSLPRTVRAGPPNTPRDTDAGITLLRLARQLEPAPAGPAPADADSEEKPSTEAIHHKAVLSLATLLVASMAGRRRPRQER